MKCSYPNLCIYYYEVESTSKPKTPICLKYDFDINYHNLDKIENCQDHKTYEQLRDN